MKNPNLKIYAISGKAQHGKDTFANVLYEELANKGYRVLLTHYADLLKYICKTFFDWNGEKDEKGRHILQYVGTDVVRKERPDYWVEFVIDMIDLFGENWDYVIIPDTRFPNEIDKLKEHYDKVEHIRVVRPNFTSTLTEEQLKHPSETALDNVEPNITIFNNGSMNDLRELVKLHIKDGVIH
jgi:hypothetical protein